MKLFDTHAHIGLIDEDPIEQLIITKEAKQAGIAHIVSICNNLQDFFRSMKTCQQHHISIIVSASLLQKFCIPDMIGN